MLERFPFPYRAGLLAALMVIAAMADLCRHGKAATRYKEYAFIWFAGIIGCLIGGGADLITSTISPEYFTFGKGLSGDEGFKMRTVVFGVKEGLSAGVIGGAFCVYVSRRKSNFPALGFAELACLLWMPIASAVIGAVFLPLVAGRSDPAGLGTRIDGVISVAQIPAFLRVWWIHTGLYGGLLAGLLWLMAVVHRRRKAASVRN